eukprot:6214989-Amphidinium_carterae.1
MQVCRCTLAVQCKHAWIVQWVPRNRVGAIGLKLHIDFEQHKLREQKLYTHPSGAKETHEHELLDKPLQKL